MLIYFKLSYVCPKTWQFRKDEGWLASQGFWDPRISIFFGTHVLLNVFLHISITIFGGLFWKGGGVWLATQSTPWICPWERQVVANSKSTVACVYPLHKNNMLSYAEKTPPQRECQDFVTLLYLYIYFLTVFYIIMLLKLYMFVCQYLNKDSTPLSHWLKTTITIQLKLGQAVRRQN